MRYFAPSITFFSQKASYALTFGNQRKDASALAYLAAKKAQRIFDERRSGEYVEAEQHEEVLV
jgi:hypothetical protein